MQSQSEARRVIDRVLAAVRKLGGAEAVVRLWSKRGGNTRFAVNELTTSSTTEELELRLILRFGQRNAFSTINQTDDAAIDGLVARTAAMARLAPEDPEIMPVLGPQRYVAIAGAIDPATAKLTPEVRAKAAAATIARADAAKVAVAGFLDHGAESLAIGTTAGLAAYHAWTACSMSCTARTPDGTGSGWAGQTSNRYADLDPGALARTAVDKAVASARPQHLDPGRYTVVLEPEAVADLLEFFTGELDARSADEGRSFFAKTRPGAQLFPDTITLRNDPTEPALTAQPFDSEGMPFTPARWVDKGKLTGLRYSRFWAKKQGVAPTGSGWAWTLDAGTSSRDDLITGVQRGVLITRLWYLRPVDPQSLLVTGLTRDGTFLIENGQISHPVNNFRFNESPIQMLAKCDGLSKTLVTLGNGHRVPALRTHEFNLASISEAV